MIRVDPGEEERISQGDIYRNIEHIEYVVEQDGIIEISKIIFPYIIVLTQDCDLAQDYMFRKEPKKTQDKLLISVLVAPIYNADHVFAGTHLNDPSLGLSMEIINEKRSPGKTLKQNERPRYHYLEFPEDVSIVPSIIDFKHYFSVNIKYLESISSTQFVCRISDLYREDVSQRFASFLSRIGLPDEKDECLEGD